MTLETKTTSQVADRLDILDLTARYNHAIDSGDGESWAQTFTPDGIFRSARGDIVGRADLAKFATDWFAGSEDTRRHWVCNQVVEVDGDTATQRAYLQLVRSGSEPTILSTARYEDQLTRGADGWLFTVRHVMSDTQK